MTEEPGVRSRERSVVESWEATFDKRKRRHSKEQRRIATRESES